MVVASLGAEDAVDIELARELVEVVERCAPKPIARRGEVRAATMRVAREMRKIEGFLKMLASRRLGLSRHLPPPPERGTVLEALVRSRLEEPTSSPREEDVLSQVKAFAA